MLMTRRVQPRRIALASSHVNYRPPYNSPNLGSGAEPKVFWFFSSEKNTLTCLLKYLSEDQPMTTTALRKSLLF
jgi:hypothetical protein